MYSRKQSPYCPAWRLDSSNPTDVVAKCRSPVQCRRMHHKLGYARREQGQDCPVRGFGSLDQTGQVQGYASSEECHRRSSKHDTLWCVFFFFFKQNSFCFRMFFFFCWCGGTCTRANRIYLNNRREPATAGQRRRHPRPCPASVFSRCRRPILLYDRSE